MKVVRDYLLIRPLGAIINGVAIGAYLPLSMAGVVGEKVGRAWAIVLIPLWLGLAVLAIPLAILFCLVMVMAKGPLWQYPPDQRGKPIDWAVQERGPGRDA